MRVISLTASFSHGLFLMTGKIQIELPFELLAHKSWRQVDHILEHLILPAMFLNVNTVELLFRKDRREINCTNGNHKKVSTFTLDEIREECRNIVWEFLDDVMMAVWDKSLRARSVQLPYSPPRVLYDSRPTRVFGIVATWEVYERNNPRSIDQRLIDDFPKLLYPSCNGRDAHRKYDDSKQPTVTPGLSRDDLGGRIAVHSLR
jgi:hypothetical protein